MSEETGNKDFETKVLMHLSELSTKMNMLVSDDGETGSVPRLQNDVRLLERKIWWFSGAAIGAAGVIQYIVNALKAFRGK